MKVVAPGTGPAIVLGSDGGPRVEPPRLCYSPTKRAFLATAWLGTKRIVKCVPVSVQDEGEAKRWVAAWWQETLKVQKVARNQAVPRALRTVSGLLPQWQDWKRQQPKAEAKKVDTTASALGTYLGKHRLGDLDLEKVKTGEVAAWVEWLRQQRSARTGRALAPFTVRNIITAAAGFFSDCRGKGWVDARENPFRDPFVRSMAAGAKKRIGDDIVHLLSEQAKALVECDTPPPLRRVRNVLGLCTGLRASEMAALAWEHVKESNEITFVDVARQLVKGGAVWELRDDRTAKFKPPKRSSYRQVPLHPLAVQALRWWKETGWQQWVGRPPRPEDPVFPDHDGRFYNGPHARMLREDLVSAGVSPVFTLSSGSAEVDVPQSALLQGFHALRRTFLTMLTDADVQDSHVSALAGHGAKTVTQRNYVARHVDRFHADVLKLPLPTEVDHFKKEER